MFHTATFSSQTAAGIDSKFGRVFITCLLWTIGHFWISHYSDIKITSCHLNSPAPRVFDTQLVQADIKGSIKFLHHCPFIPLAMGHRHDDVIQWKHFPHNWPFVRGIHRSPVNSPQKGQWRGALIFSLIWINGWVNNREAGDLRRHPDNENDNENMFITTDIYSISETNARHKYIGKSIRQ